MNNLKTLQNPKCARNTSVAADFHARITSVADFNLRTFTHATLALCGKVRTQHPLKGVICVPARSRSLARSVVCYATARGSLASLPPYASRTTLPTTKAKLSALSRNWKLKTERKLV